MTGSSVLSGAAPSGSLAGMNAYFLAGAALAAAIILLIIVL